MRTFTLLLCLVAVPAAADEGMWTFDNFPSQRVKQKYGFGPSQRWLDHVRSSAARLSSGCSASFVSGQGLLMTNHHCVVRCLQQLSTAEADYVRNGFQADAADQEAVCPAMEVDQLQEITDVTDRMRRATEGKTGQAFIDARKAETAAIESECTEETERCDVVDLYEGGLFHRYRYRRVREVRLVFAPSDRIAAFGGDPDNFNFPRYNLDVAFIRAYEDGRPFRNSDHLRFSKAGVKAGDLVFVAGHPGSTSRLQTTAQLAYTRDWALPEILHDLAETRGILDQFGRASDEKARIVGTRLFRLDNAIKALTGRREALVDPLFFKQLVDAENAFFERLPPGSDAIAAFEAIGAAQQRKQALRMAYRQQEAHRGYGSLMLGAAVHLVRWATEKTKPSGERLEEYADARVTALRARVVADVPIHPDLEATLLGHNLERMRADLGPDDPFVKEVLGTAAPFDVARRVVEGSTLADPAVRTKLFDGAPAAVNDADDPMLALARILDRAGRRIRRRYEAEVESVEARAAEVIADARFEVFGTERYPDATFSLRLSYGTVDGFPHRGTRVDPFTTVAGLYARATGSEPFQLDDAWKSARERIDLATPMNFVSTNDIIGGNSGSPILDRRGEVVGIVFDGNIYSLGGDFGFDPRVNRAVSVDARAIRLALQRVYGVRRLLKELRFR
jgi:hypothetical protein